MNAIKKSALAAAVLMSMGAGAAQAAIAQYDFTGAFVMFNGSDPSFGTVPVDTPVYDEFGEPVLDSAGNPVLIPTFDSALVNNGNGLAGDAISGSMFFDTLTGAGTATMIPSTTFFGDAWSAVGITLQGTMNPGEVNFAMLFNWGAVDGTTTCGVVNCDIGVTGTFQMFPTTNPMVSGFYTTASSMPGGPFAGMQPTFNGQATLVPEASTYGMMLAGLGLVGFAVRRRQQIAA